jgi:antitoxin MazE
MARLIRIGNSRGIRIPKALLDQADLEGRELELRLVDDGLLVTPAARARHGWQAAFEAMAAAGDDAPLLPNHPLARFDEEDWEW